MLKKNKNKKIKKVRVLYKNQKEKIDKRRFYFILLPSSLIFISR